MFFGLISNHFDNEGQLMLEETYYDGLWIMSYIYFDFTKTKETQLFIYY